MEESKAMQNKTSNGFFEQSKLLPLSVLVNLLERRGCKSSRDSRDSGSDLAPHSNFRCRFELFKERQQDAEIMESI